jgi:dipeptidyl-peptidase-4
MTCLALTRRPDVFRVGVAIAPVTDWRLYDTIYTERYMGLPAENPEGYDETSSTRHAAGLAGRLLLLHGLGDDNVHAQNSFQLVSALVKADRQGFDLMAYPAEGHGLGGVREDLYRRLVAYFDDHL